MLFNFENILSGVAQNLYTVFRIEKMFVCNNLHQWWARSESTGGIAPNFFQEGV